MKRIAVLLIISCAFISACSSTKWARTTVVKEYDFKVTLEQQENAENAPQKYEHPYEIGLADLEKLLGDLTYSEKVGLQNTEKQNPVFQAVEIDRMAPALAEALAKADASQRVRFTSFNLEQAALFSDSQKTEGVLFIASDERLNIAFNFINSKRNPSETSAVYHSYSKVEPLKIKTSETTISATAPYAEQHRLETGKQAPMWVVADLDEMKEETSVAAASVVEVTEEVAPVVAPRTERLDPPAEETASTQAPEEQLREDIKNKLRFLKELLDEGLISEQDYNLKKVEVLDKID